MSAAAAGASVVTAWDVRSRTRSCCCCCCYCRPRCSSRHPRCFSCCCRRRTSLQQPLPGVQPWSGLLFACTRRTGCRPCGTGHSSASRGHTVFHEDRSELKVFSQVITPSQGELGLVRHSGLAELELGFRKKTPPSGRGPSDGQGRDSSPDRDRGLYGTRQGEGGRGKEGILICERVPAQWSPVSQVLTLVDLRREGRAGEEEDRWDKSRVVTAVDEEEQQSE